MIITNGKHITSQNQVDFEEIKGFMSQILSSMGKDPDKVLEKYAVQEANYFGYKIPQGIEVTQILEMGAELRPLTDRDVIRKPGTVYKTVKHVFTEEEQAHHAQEMADGISRKRELEDELKKIKSSFKAKMDEVDANINKYSEFYRNGYDYLEKKCVEILSYQEGKKFFEREDTGKIVLEEPLNPQMALPFMYDSDDFEEEDEMMKAIHGDENKSHDYEAEAEEIENLGAEKPENKKRSPKNPDDKPVA